MTWHTPTIASRYAGATARSPDGIGVIMAEGEAIQLALQHALRSTFMVMLLIGLLIVPVCVLVPRHTSAAGTEA
jgi:hypothetical protein